MKRRSFIAASTAALGAQAGAQTPQNQIFHLVYYYMRSGPQVDRTTEFLSTGFLSAARRAGIGPIGLFSPVIGERSPYILSLTTCPSLAAMETMQAKLAAGKEFAAWDTN